MRLLELVLGDVRNYAALRFEPGAGLNAIIGANGQGKSNLLEAIGVLAIGKSFRARRDRELIRFGCRAATIEGRAEARVGVVNLGCELRADDGATRKRYAVNGEPVRHARYLGRTRVVSFEPADLALASGAAILRRRFLNAALAQEDPLYYDDLATYARTVAQKNALLRGGIGIDEELLEIYDERLARNGARLMTTRARFIGELGAHAARAYAAWSGGERLEVVYRPAQGTPGEDIAALAEELRTAMRAARQRERLRRTTLVGPHRDDLELTLEGHALGVYGSQGQRRTAVLALKVGEYAVVSERSGDPPILLLDDVLSELDPERQRAFLEGVGSYDQAFVTATVAPGTVVPSATFRVVDGRVTRC